ncbi:hypothetical protein MRB53_015631 [Persea americana]|uniref:Uncharacterized protein n=1 Tax=Persea americana TaxID=3435 RepID=A0ACC2LZN1_PERAE|nr:hypothetical protein MRB53_015631 [Persea americana]
MTSCTVESKSVCAVVPSPVSFTSRCNFHTLPSSQLSFGLHFNLLGVGEGMHPKIKKRAPPALHYDMDFTQLYPRKTIRLQLRGPGLIYKTIKKHT